eukprot:CAMPEP_0183716922 /NCGR_PEP_ID=MMETSP0737-20130205/10661_1 /TAXON_ID=385413 /ORGANISM="Thalassiosira miniscula, Strain CCMP1093" /LENGTH=289 /DNA_ID=CAMNT_0025946253 /DNA_START=149 /DNA_END=1018 /DNA_ORIENTATION=+
MKLLNAITAFCALSLPLVAEGGPSAPGGIPTGNNLAGTGGDPHFTLWSGKKFDFHGECDLVLLRNDDFMNGLGMHIHIRTKIVTFFSAIEAIAIKIGDDVFEVQGGMDTEEKYTINGVEGGTLSYDANFAIAWENIKDYKRYEIRVDDNDHGGQIAMHLKIRNFMGLRFVHDTSEDIAAANFATSSGLMGDYMTGLKLGRNREVIEDTNAFAMAWQVGPEDPVLLSPKAGTVQYPEQCKMPSITSRRLQAGAITDGKARSICKGASELEDCVFDVMATNTADVAMDYFD